MQQSTPAMDVVGGSGPGFDTLVHLQPPILARKWLLIIADEHIDLTAGLNLRVLNPNLSAIGPSVEHSDELNSCRRVLSQTRKISIFQRRLRS
jgi:hypothetical protein